jgi:hypothetical protein
MAAGGVPGKPIASVLKPGTVPPYMTVAVDCASPGLKASTLALSASNLSLSVPANASGPAQTIGVTSRKTITIINPVDGQPFVVGQDAALTLANGHQLYPGDALTISGYISPIWTLGFVNASTAYYQVT